MAKQISQETFDAAVKENIDEFEMEAEEALNDAVQQFASAGQLSLITRNYRPQTKFGKGNVFTGVCVSKGAGRGGGGR